VRLESGRFAGRESLLIRVDDRVRILAGLTRCSGARFRRYRTGLRPAILIQGGDADEVKPYNDRLVDISAALETVERRGVKDDVAEGCGEKNRCTTASEFASPSKGRFV
jgi:hypothetical protein